MLSVDVSGAGQESIIRIGLSAEVAYEAKVRPDGEREVLLRNTRVPTELVRRVNASAVDGPVGVVATFMDADETSAHIRVTVKPTVEDVKDELKLRRSESAITLEWKLSGLAKTRSAIARRSREEAAEEARSSPTPPRQATKPAAAGKRMNFDAQDMDIHDFLDAIAEVSGRNIVAHSGVDARVTVRLRNLPWEEVLDIVLAQHNLAREDVGNVIMVASPRTLERDAKRRSLLRQR